MFLFSKMQRFFLAYLIVWGFLFPGMISVAVAAPKGAEGNPYTVGIVPQFDARRLHATWRPILDALTVQTGLHFALKGSSSIPAFEREVLAGDFDFAYMNPYQMLLAHERYSPLVRDVGKSLYGILVVHKESPLKDIEDLRGERVAFPAPNALGASLLVRAELKELHGIEIKPRYVRSHTSVYLNVVLDETTAGGGVQKTLNQQSAEIRNALRVIYKTREVSPHPFAAHLNIPQEVRSRVQQAMLDMDDSTNGRQLLSRVPVVKLGVATLDDYEPLQQLGLGRYYVQE